MKSRTTLIFAVVALIVGGLVVFDFKQGTTTERRLANSRRVVEFKAEDVTRLELVQTNLTLVVEKSAERWQIKQPLNYRADTAAINSIIDGLEFADKDRTLTEKDLAGMYLADLGLAPPRATLTLTTKQGETKVLLGGETPTKNAIYVQIAGRPAVYVTDKSLLGRVARPLTDFRDRTVLDFEPGMAMRVELKSAERIAELTRTASPTGEQLWSLVRPLATRADQRKVSELLNSLAGLRAAEFVSDDPKDGHAYKLNEPGREITVSKSGTEGMLTLLVSAPLTNDATKVYAKLKNSDTIVTLNVADVQKSDLPVADLRDRQVLTFAEPAVQTVEIQRGADSLALARTNDLWRLTAPVAEEADETRVATLLGALKGLQVQQFVADVATDLEKYGLAVPAAIVKLQGAGTNVVSHLLISAVDASNSVCYVKRESEPFIYSVAATFAGSLPVDHWALRTRRVAELAPAGITKLEVQRPTGKLIVERDAQALWRLVEPAQGALNSDDVEVVVDVLARLDAEEFHTAKPVALNTPDHTFSVTVGDKTYALALAGTEAAWSDPALNFSLPGPTVQTLTKELLAVPSVTNAPPVELGRRRNVAALARGRPTGYKFRVRRFFRFLERLIGLALVLALVGLGYLHVSGFPPFLIRLLEQQMQRTGLVIHFAEIRLDLFRGVVAREARLADARLPDRTLVQVDELVLQPNWHGLLHHGQPVRALRIANATVAVPTPPDEQGGAIFTARDAYATVEFREDGTVVLDRLTGLYCGIQLYVTGQVKPTKSAEPPPPGRSPFRFVTKVVRELNRVKVSAPPQLDVNFDIDLARPLEGRARVRLLGQGMELRGARVDNVRVIVVMKDGAVEFQQFDLELYRGAVRFRGKYDIARGAFDLEVTSSTDPTAFAAFAPPAIGAAITRELKVHDNPRIVVRYVLAPETGPLPELQGSLRAGAFTLRGVDFLRVDAEFANHGADLTVTNALIVMREGRLTGQGEFNIESTDFSYQLASTLDPPKLLPLMSPVMKRIVEPSWFATSPHIVAQISGDFVDPDAFAYDAVVQAGACSYRGVNVQRASGRLKLRQSQLAVRDLQIVRPEGEATGTLFADFNENRLSFDIASTANPNELAPLLGPKAAATMLPYRFGPHTDGNARGLIDFDNSTNTAWQAHVVGDGFSYWKFTADRAEANLVFTNNTFQINDFKADLYTGQLTGTAQFAFVDTNVTYRFVCDLQHGDVNQMLTAIGGSAKATGFLTGQMEVNGEGSDAHNLGGGGALSITDGVLWEAPLFGIFSHILGKTKATSAKADFKIKDYAWQTENLTVEAGAFTAKAPGRIRFDGKMDFRVQAQFLRGIPGINILTKIIGVLLEYDVGGTIGNPNYRAANLPKEILPHSGTSRDN